MAANSLKDIDNGWKALKKNLKKLKNDELVVGIPGNIDFGTPTQAAIGAVHEFGSADGSIPSRSFLRSTFDKNVNKYNKILSDNIQKSFKLGPQKQALFVLGETVRRDVIEQIKNKGIKQDLSEATINAFVPGTTTRRGEGPALISTGGLVGSIVSIVRKRAK